MKTEVKNFSAILKRLEVWLFYFFLLTMALSVRKIVYMRQIRSSFNEYSNIYIYLSDIALISVFFLFILNNRNIILSNIKGLKMFHVEQLQKKYYLYKKRINNCSTWNNYSVIKDIIPRPPASTFQHFVPRGTFIRQIYIPFIKFLVACRAGGTIIIKKSYTQIVNNYWIIFPLVAVLFSFSSILWTTYAEIALFRSIKLLEFVALYFYIIHIVPRGTNDIKQNLFHVEQINKNDLKRGLNDNEKCSTWNKIKTVFFKNVPRGTFLKNSLVIIILVGLINSLIAIAQFALRHSSGLFWLKESIISSEIPGVAKISLDGDVYIRAYGLFPHPNILGGYLVFSIILTLLYLKLFHVEHKKEKTINEKTNCSTCSTCRQEFHEINTNLTNKCSTWNKIVICRGRRAWNKCKKLMNFINNSRYICKIVPRGTILLKLILSIQVIALMLTFSKSAIFGLVIGLFWIFAEGLKKNVPRGTKVGKFNLFHVEQIKKKVLVLAVLFFSLLLYVKPDYNSLFMKTLEERNFYINVSRGTIAQYFWGGVGAGQFIFQIESVNDVKDWQFQPVHNVFLLIWSEFGVFFLMAFVLFLLGLLANCSTWNNEETHWEFQIRAYLKALFIAFIFIMLFDHYFWDIQQGSLMFWILLGLMVTARKNTLLTK